MTNLPHNLSSADSDNKPTGFRSRVLAGLIIIIIIWAAITVWQNKLLAKGTVAPDWPIQFINGTQDKITLSGLKGSVVVLAFFSTTCGPCIREVPALKALHQQKTDQKIVVIGIAVGDESKQELLAFAKQHGISYPIAIDKTGYMSKEYRVRSIPTLYIIDKESKIADSRGGYWPKSALIAAVKAAANPA